MTYPRPTILIALGALLAVLVGTPPADAARSRVVKRLAAAPCPPPFSPGGLDASYSQEEIGDALENDTYRIAAGIRVRLVPPVDWDQEPPGGLNRQSFRNGLASLNWIKVLVAAYSEAGTGAERKLALAKARNLILDFVRDQPHRGPTTTHEAWGSKRAGDRLTLISYLLRVWTCEKVLGRSGAADLLASVTAHADFIERFRSSSNHGLFDAYGLAVAARELPFMSEAKHWRKLGKRRFDTILRGRTFPEEGIWLDHTTNYAFVVVRLVEDFLEIPGAGDNSLRNLREKMQDAAAWLVEADDRRLQWGDSNAEPAPREYIDASHQDQGLEAKLRSGLAFVRDGGRYLAVLASYLSRVHKHSDDLSFELYDHGRQIVGDTGSFGRDAGTVRDFERSAEAHSTLTVDDQPFDRSGDRAYGSGLVAAGSGDGWYAINARNPLLGKGVKHHRWVVYKPGQALIVVDRVRSDAPHKYTRHLHFGPDLSLAPPLLGSMNLVGSGFDGAVFDRSSVASQVTRVRGQASPLQGWTYPGFNQQIPRWTASFSSTAKNADYVTGIALTAQGLHAQLAAVPTPDNVSLELEQNSAPAGSLEIARTRTALSLDAQP